MIIKKCRLCGSKQLKQVLNLGKMALTGIFLNAPVELKKYPLVLMKCQGKCGLVQLKHVYDKSMLFGETYGYRSSLNQSMVKHLEAIVREIEKRKKLTKNSSVLDVGSNDATLLKLYKLPLWKYGVEPNIKFNKYYEGNCWKLNDFLPLSIVPVMDCFDVITSIAMFYDIQNPLLAAKQIHTMLKDDGNWVLEVADWPQTVKQNSYDTICHEHACYYSLDQIKYLMDKAGFKIIDTNHNLTNGGSIRVTVQKQHTRQAKSSKKPSKRS